MPSNIKRLVNHFKQKIEWTYYQKSKNFYKKIGINKPFPEQKEKPKIVFFFGAGASHPAGGWLQTSEVNNLAKESLGSIKNIKKFVKNEELNEICLTYKDLDKPDELIFEQIMSLLRKYYGEWPECAEVLLFQKVFPREELIDFERDIVPVPLIYEITAHLMKHGLIDHVITTNFDELLDRILTSELGKKEYVRVHHLSKYESVLIDKVYETKPLLIKVHGTLSYSLTLRQLVDNVVNLERYKYRLMEKVLEDAVVVVIGYSFYNPNIQKLFYRLKTKGQLKDIFIVKRSPVEGDFISWLIDENPDNLILMDCEKFAYNLVCTIEKIEINVENNIKNGAEKNRDNINVTRLIPSFTAHLLRNFYLKDLKLFPCPQGIYALEFFISLLKSRGLLAEESLRDNQKIVRTIKKEPLYLDSVEKLIGTIESKKTIDPQNKQKDLPKNIKEIIEEIDFIIHIGSGYVDNSTLKHSFDILKKIYIFLKNLDEDSSKNDKNECIEALQISFKSVIISLNNIKRSIITKNYEITKDLINKLNWLLYITYESYQSVLNNLKALSNMSPSYILEKIIDDTKSNNSIIKIEKIPLTKLCENGNCTFNCLKYDSAKYDSAIHCTPKSKILENVYCLMHGEPRNPNERSPNERPPNVCKTALIILAKNLLNEKIIFYDSFITGLINYLSNKQNDEYYKRKLTEYIEDFLEKKFDDNNDEEKEYGNKDNLIPTTDLLTKYDVEIKQYQHILPILSPGANYSKDNNGSTKIIIPVEDKYDLEIINNYILSQIGSEGSYLFVIAETGEWITNQLKRKMGNNKQIKSNIFLATSDYNCFNKLDSNYTVYHYYYHSKKYEGKIQDWINKTYIRNHKMIPFCINDLHFTLLKERGNKEAYQGIIFYRALKSSIISPVFIKTEEIKQISWGLYDILDYLKNKKC